MFSAPRTSTRNQFCASQRMTGRNSSVGELRVEAELVHRVVAAHPRPREGGQLVGLGSPVDPEPLGDREQSPQGIGRHAPELFGGSRLKPFGDASQLIHQLGHHRGQVQRGRDGAGPGLLRVGLLRRLVIDGWQLIGLGLGSRGLEDVLVAKRIAGGGRRHALLGSASASGCGSRWRNESARGRRRRLSTASAGRSAAAQLDDFGVRHGDQPPGRPRKRARS